MRPGMVLRPDVITIGMGSNDTSSMAAGGTAAAGAAGNNASTWRSKLWDRVDILCEDIYNNVLQVWTLQRVLDKKRDPLTNALFGDVFIMQHDERNRIAANEAAVAAAAAVKREKEKKAKTGASGTAVSSSRTSSISKESKTSAVAIPSSIHEEKEVTIF